MLSKRLRCEVSWAFAQNWIFDTLEKKQDNYARMQQAVQYCFADEKATNCFDVIQQGPVVQT